jgi:hypothetical protein
VVAIRTLNWIDIDADGLRPSGRHTNLLPFIAEATKFAQFKDSLLEMLDAADVLALKLKL